MLRKVVSVAAAIVLLVFGGCNSSTVVDSGVKKDTANTIALCTGGLKNSTGGQLSADLSDILDGRAEMSAQAASEVLGQFYLNTDLTSSDALAHYDRYLRCVDQHTSSFTRAGSSRQASCLRECTEDLQDDSTMGDLRNNECLVDAKYDCIVVFKDLESDDGSSCLAQRNAQCESFVASRKKNNFGHYLDCKEACDAF